MAAPCRPLISETTVHQVGTASCTKKAAAAFSTAATRADAEGAPASIANPERESAPPPTSRRLHLRLAVRRLSASTSQPPTRHPAAPPIIIPPESQPADSSDSVRASLRY